MDSLFTIDNPVLAGMYPDPSWIWDAPNTRVALVNSSFEMSPGLPIHVSQDLQHWELLGSAIDDAMAERLLLRFVPDSGGIFAPTLRRIGNGYAIACTVANIDFQAARDAGCDVEEIMEAEGNFVITADRLEGPWHGPFWVRGANGIDPDLFEDIDGSVWWTQTRPSVDPRWEGNTQVWTQQINPVTWQLQPGADDYGPFSRTVIWEGFGIEAVWAEGPHLFRHGPYVYLMTAEGGTSFDHSEMLMRTLAPEGFAAALAEFPSVRLISHHADSCDTDLTADSPYVMRAAIKDDAEQTSSPLSPDRPSDPSLPARKANTLRAVEDVDGKEEMETEDGARADTCRLERTVYTYRNRLFHPDKKNPILTHRHLGSDERVQCVGHADVLCHPTLGWWLVALGSPQTPCEDGSHLNFLGRQSYLYPVKWDRDPQPSVASDNNTIDDPGWLVGRYNLGRLVESMTIDTDADAVADVVIEEGPDTWRILDLTITPQRGADWMSLRCDDSVLWHRLESDRTVIVLPSDCDITLRQNNLHHVIIQPPVVQDDGSLCVAWRVVNGAHIDDRMVALPDNPEGCLVAVFADGRLGLGLMADEELESVLMLDDIDARFLSTEWSGGFVGCLVGRALS